MYIIGRHYGRVVATEEIVRIWDARAGAESTGKALRHAEQGPMRRCKHGAQDRCGAVS